MPTRRALVAGATGYIGRLLAKELATTDTEVRAMARNPSKAEDLKAAGCEVVKGDVLEPDTLREALEGADVAYYLVHSMGRGADSDFVERDKRAARNFGDAAKEAGVGEIVYL